MAENKAVEVLYDRECPVCEFYCQRIDVAENVGTLVRVDAREDSELLDEVSAVGLDIDEGMVLRVDDDIYYGSDAINKLAVLSSRKGIINRAAYWTFRHAKVAAMLYPVLASLRNILLKLLGRSRINNLQIKDNNRF